MSDWCDGFVNSLARSVTGAELYNQYADTSEQNALRRANLRRYLRDMEQRRPEALMLFEAPGYRGCRLTGIPVTSRRVLLEGVAPLGLFGRERGYLDVAEEGFEGVQGEQSATILWRTLAELRVAPLIWNSVPFHPQRAGRTLSNRTPRAAELAQGRAYLVEVLSHFRPRVPVAVGRSAQGSLAALGLEHHALRHPAHGGSGEFAEGLRALCVEEGLVR